MHLQPHRCTVSSWACIVRRRAPSTHLLIKLEAGTLPPLQNVLELSAQGVRLSALVQQSLLGPLLLHLPPPPPLQGERAAEGGLERSDERHIACPRLRALAARHECLVPQLDDGGGQLDQ
eukprot:scaffold3813_cov31-Tisochrysis_lutea.AAC.1